MPSTAKGFYYPDGSNPVLVHVDMKTAMLSIEPAFAARYGVFTGTTGGGSSGVNYANAGALTLEAAQSSNSPAVASGSSLHIAEPGRYAITRTFKLTAGGATTGRSYIDLIAGGFQMRSSLYAGEDKSSASIASVRLPSGGDITFNTYMIIGSSYSWTGSIIVDRIGDA